MLVDETDAATQVLAAANADALADIPTVEHLVADDLSEINRIESEYNTHFDNLIAKAERHGQWEVVAAFEASKADVGAQASEARRHATERARAAHKEAVAAAERFPTSEQIAAVLGLEAAFGRLRQPYEELAAAAASAAAACVPESASLPAGIDDFIEQYRSWALNTVAACISFEQTFDLAGRECPLRSLDLAAL